MTNVTSVRPKDPHLLEGIRAIAQSAGSRLQASYTADSRPADRDEVFRALEHNEAVALGGIRDELLNACPHVGWLDERFDSTTIADGEWWTVDGVEGNINHIHGMAEWGVTITLIRDQVPVLAVVHHPLPNLTYSALIDHGASVNGRPLHVSPKATLDLAIGSTGQAESGQTTTYRRIGESITAMLGSALLIRASVPSTFPMLSVASGHTDIFWQYEPVLPGIAAGILFIREAGGTVTRIDGSPWSPGAPDILAAAPAVHQAAAAVLRKIR